MASDDALMSRLIGGNDTTSDHYLKTRRVLTGLSLFQKIGYEGTLAAESEWLAKFIGIDWNSFKDIVTTQQRKGILQGQHYVYVTPFMLRVNLLKEWWEDTGLTKENFENFFSDIPEDFRVDLFERFIEHIPYVGTTERGREFAEEVLGAGGIFADGKLLDSELGGRLFLALTDANPDAALGCLNRTLGTWTDEQLLEFNVGRRHIVWALERIVIWRELFVSGSLLLLALAETENETWSNNATGVFSQLFSPGYGAVASTEASPVERFPVLEDAMNSSSKERRSVAMKACASALSTGPFSRTVGAEHQGLRRDPQLWIPKGWNEILDAYSSVWELLEKQLDGLAAEEKKVVLDILLQNARGVSSYPDLADMVIDTLKGLSKRSDVDSKDILETVIRILHYEGKDLSPELRDRWEQLKDDLTGQDFPSLLRRYVGTDFLEDRFDDEGNRVDQKQEKIRELALQAFDNPDQFKSELSWLATEEAVDGFRFGYELALRDEGFSLLTELIDVQRTAGTVKNLYFLGGYTRRLFETDSARWEELMDQLVQDEQGRVWVPELTWRSSLPSDRSGIRIIELAEKGYIDNSQFRWFAFGGTVNNLSREVFDRWIEFLLASPDPISVSNAADLYHFFYVFDNPEVDLPKELTWTLLTHDLWFAPPEGRKKVSHDDFHWSELAKAFLNAYPDFSLGLADRMLKHYGESETIVDGSQSRTQTVLADILRQFPDQTWSIIVRYLGPPIDTRAHYIKTFLRGGSHIEGAAPGPIDLIPQEKIWDWVDEEIDARAWYLASFVPKNLFRSDEKPCLARELLVRYGDREDVRRNLRANLSTEGWTGPASMHNENKKRELLDFRIDESDANVIQWLDEYIASLQDQVKSDLIREERRGF